MKNKTTSRNTNIDAVRGIACVFVVFVHCVMPGRVGEYMMYFARFAVPFFLLVSGWFAYQGSTEQSLQAASRKLKDTVRLAGITAVLYTLWNSLNCLIGGRPVFAWLTPYFNRDSLINLLVFNRAVFFNSITYYLLMMIYVYVIYMWLVKKGWMGKTGWFIAIALTANYVLDAFLHQNWYYSGNFLLTGLPFFFLGHQLHSHFSGRVIPVKMTKGALAFGVVLTFAESTLLGDVYCYIGSMITAVSLLLLCLGTENQPRLRNLSDFGRRYSVYILILHCGIRDTLNVTVFDSGSALHQTLMPFAAIAIAVCIGLLVEKMKRSKDLV